MSIRTKNTIALTCVALFFIGLVLYLHSLDSRTKAVIARQPELARENAELSRQLSLIGEPEPGQAPPGYWQYGSTPFLATCGVCKGKVSSDAKACPHCGDPR